MSEHFILEGGELLAVALERARRAGTDWPTADAAYQSALRLVNDDDTELWSAMAAEHISVLRARGALTAAAARCEDHLRDSRIRVPGHRVPLLLERAQVRSQSGEHVAAGADAAAVRAMVESDPRAGLDAADHARLRRVEALAAAEAGDHAIAARYLAEARDAFLSAGDSAASAVVDGDLRLLAVRNGSDEAVAEVLAEAPSAPMSVPRALAYALALKRRLRYEEALAAIVEAVAAEDFDEAVRLPVLNELVALLALLRRGRALEALGAQFWSFVRHGGAAEGSAPPALRFNQTLLEVFDLLERGEPADALAGLEAVRALAASDRDHAHWHLAAGQAGIALFKRFGRATDLEEAIGHLDTAIQRASAEWLLEVRIRALRLQGEAWERLKKPERASARWAQAHDLEEILVARQVSDKVRATLLTDIPDEHDERVRVAAETALSVDDRDRAAAAVAAAIAAMESARGAAILGRIAPGHADVLRWLPAPGDEAGAWRWLRRIADSMAPDEAIWILHARPDRVHHGIIGRNLAHHIDVPADRGELEEAVRALRELCNEVLLPLPDVRAEFTRIVERLGAGIGAPAALAHVPPRVKRLVVVAGGVLSDIPLAALSIPAGADGELVPIVCRFALSDLPCISARPLLRQRSVRNRGRRALVAREFRDGIPARRPWRKVLAGHEATPEAFARELRGAAYRKVRIVGHGRSDSDDASQSWLQLAAGDASGDGRLRPERMQELNLAGCGTLILEACESGMAQRVGRDERTGFVRAGLHAGAASVVAARWVAADSVAAALLERFEDHLRYLPRDFALQRAQLEVRGQAVRLAKDVPDPGHPAWWSCWTLYGDPGYQVRAPGLRWLARRLSAGRVFGTTRGTARGRNAAKP